jgi:tetratricopeptide (TPR) repeat protein
MKKTSLLIVLAIVACACMAPAAFAQTTKVKGNVKDMSGKIMVGATVEYQNLDNGRKYTFKTDKEGNYFGLNVWSGKYKISVSSPELQQPIVAANNYQITLQNETTTYDIDLQQMAKEQGAKGPSPEEVAAHEAALKEHNKIQGLNAMLTQASTQKAAGDYAGAVQTLTQAVNTDATHDIVWANLAETERVAGNKTPTANKDQRTKYFTDSITHFQKAISLKPDAAYYAGMADAFGKLGKIDDATKAYNQAIAANPQNAAAYYFGLGASLTNAGRTEEATAAFDKAIAADPSKPDAYYWKGINLMAKATTNGDKFTAPAGTAEAFNKYLELAPEGPNAATAKEMLSQIGAKVESNYGKPKAGKKK